MPEFEEQFSDFFGMIRGMFLAIGWLVTGIIWLIGLPFQLAKEKKEEQEQKSLEEKRKAERFPDLKGDTAALEANVSRAFLEQAPSDAKLETMLDERVRTLIKDPAVPKPFHTIAEPLIDALFEYAKRDEHFHLPSRRAFTDAIDEGRYRDQLKDAMKKVERPEQASEAIVHTLAQIYRLICQSLPPMARAVKGQYGVEPFLALPLIDVLPNTHAIVHGIAQALLDDAVRDLDLFWRPRFDIMDAMGAFDHKGKVVTPGSFDGSARACVHKYLGKTPFAELFYSAVPFGIPLERRFEHTAIVAGTGHGKTQLLQAMILHDLQQADPPAMVVLDSTGQMVRAIQRLAVFSDRLKDRLIIIDPESDPVPALNMFDVSNPRLQDYGAGVKEEVEREIIQLFNYVFAVLSTELTGRQSTAFSYVVRLMLTMPGANLDTLRELLEDPFQGGSPKFRQAIARLDDTAQAYFRNQFYARNYTATRMQIAQRLYSILETRAFQRMFATKNKLDMYDALQRGCIVLVNTSFNLLKRDGSSLFGRYMIARAMAAVYERANIPPTQRKPTFLIVDEAAPYFDESFEEMLTRVRQFKLGIVIAFQTLAQTSETLRRTISTNTSVKFAGLKGYDDARILARDMFTEPEFIRSQEVHTESDPPYTEFACYVNNYTRQAVSLTVPIGLMEREPQMTQQQYEDLLARNAERVADTGSGELREPQAEAPCPEPLDTPNREMLEDDGSEGATSWS